MNSGDSKAKAKNQYLLQILNPVGVLRFKVLPPAKRLDDLRNKKIGLYWNRKARGEVALEKVKELLSERFAGIAFEWFETPTAVGATREWLENVKKKGVDGVVASSGD